MVVAVHEAGEVAGRLPYPIGDNFQSGLNLHVRIQSAAPAEASAMVQKVRSEPRSIDPNLPVVSAATLESFRDDSLPLWAVRSGARLFSLFGITALILAVIGIYGLKSYVVARRTREIGIRMALGSTARGVVELFLREGARLAGAGLTVGIVLALTAGQLVSSMLYQVSPFDPVSLLAALAAAALAATDVPADEPQGSPRFPPSDKNKGLPDLIRCPCQPRQ